MRWQPAHGFPPRSPQELSGRLPPCAWRCGAVRQSELLPWD